MSFCSYVEKNLDELLTTTINDRRFPLSQYAEAGKLEEQLFLAGILEADVGLGILASTLDAEHLADAEALVLDELAWGELGHTGGTSRGIGRDEAAGRRGLPPAPPEEG